MPEISREKCYSAKKFGGGNMLFEGRVANSASCERVFALLKRMFGEQQLAALEVALAREAGALRPGAPPLAVVTLRGVVGGRLTGR